MPAAEDEPYRGRVDWALIARWLNRNPNKWRTVPDVSTGVAHMLKTGRIAPIAEVRGEIEVALRGIHTVETRRGTTRKGTLHIRVVRKRRSSGRT